MLWVLAIREIENPEIKEMRSRSQLQALTPFPHCDIGKTEVPDPLSYCWPCWMFSTCEGVDEI